MRGMVGAPSSLFDDHNTEGTSRAGGYAQAVSLVFRAQATRGIFWSRRRRGKSFSKKPGLPICGFTFCSAQWVRVRQGPVQICR